MSVARGRAMKAKINRPSEPHQVSEPLDPMQQYRRWQQLEGENAQLKAVCQKVLTLELTLLQRLNGKDEKLLRELIWKAHDALKGEK